MTYLNIKDPEVHRMASVLARRWQTTRTGAVRRALSEAMSTGESAIDREAIERYLDQIQPIFPPGTTMKSIDDDLYDEYGLPA